MINILPFDGAADYHGRILSPMEAGRLFDRLMKHIEWRHDEATIFGRHIITKRKVAWYGDDNYSYAYSGHTREALHWTEDLLELKSLIEQRTGRTFNSCLLNLYHDGDEGMAWHSDDEKTLEKDGAIASLSLGAERKFSFKHRQSGQTLALQLEPGSLLVMRGTTQTYWLHALPKSKKVRDPRINLTFRNMIIP